MSSEIAIARPKPRKGLLARMRRMTWNGERIDWAAYLYLLPFYLPFLVFTVAAIFFGAYVAFTEWKIIGSPEWVGLANFRRAFSDKFVPVVWSNTANFALIVVPSVTILALAFAMFVNERRHGYVFARLAFYAPRVVSVTVIGLVWVWMLDTRFGLVNQYLSRFGVPDIPWLTNPDWVLYGVGIASIWWNVGFYMVILLAALQDVPNELREAAAIDGANPFQIFWSVVIPHLRPALSLVITLEMISAFRVFSQIYIMTSGGPANASSTIIFYIYDRGFRNRELGYASALSLMLFATILIVTIIQMRIVRERA